MQDGVDGIDGRSAAQDNCDRRMDPELPKGPSVLVLEHDKTGKPIPAPAGRRERAKGVGSLATSRAKVLHDVIHEDTCSRNSICCRPQPSGRTVAITAAPDAVESFPELRPGA